MDSARALFPHKVAGAAKDRRGGAWLSGQRCSPNTRNSWLFRLDLFLAAEEKCSFVMYKHLSSDSSGQGFQEATIACYCAHALLTRSRQPFLLLLKQCSWQLRLLEATTPTAENTHRAQPDEPANLPDAAGCGDRQNTNSNWAFAARVEDDCGGGGGGEATTAGGTVMTIDDKPDNSPVSDAGEDTTGNDHDDSGKSGTSDSSGTNDTGTIDLKINSGGGGGSSSGTGSNSATPSPISPATRIKAARKAVGVSLDELVASGEKLERMRKEADQARRRVRR